MSICRWQGCALLAGASVVSCTSALEGTSRTCTDTAVTRVYTSQRSAPYQPVACLCKGNFASGLTCSEVWAADWCLGYIWFWTCAESQQRSRFQSQWLQITPLAVDDRGWQQQLQRCRQPSLNLLPPTWSAGCLTAKPLHNGSIDFQMVGVSITG